MDDNARLTIELLDRGGGPGQAATSPVIPGSTNVPGSNVVQDFHSQISQDGAGANQGKGSTANQPLPVVPYIPQPPQVSPYTTSQTASPTSTVDPLLNAVRGILQASPNTTAAELQASFGVTGERATSLLDAALGRQAALPTSPYTTSTGPTTVDPFDNINPTYPFGNPFDNINPDSPFGGRPRPSPMEPLNRPDYFGRNSPFAEPDFEQTSPQDLTEAARTINNAQTWTSPNTEGREEGPNLGGILSSLHGAAALASRFGPAGQFAATAINAGGSILGQFPALAAAMGPLAAAAPYVAVATAAVAVPAAGVAAAINEAERARGLIGNLSPELAQANAEATVRSMIANLRTAGRLGDEAADYTEQRSRLSAASQGLRDIVAEPVLQSFNKTLTGLTTAAERLDAFFTNNPTFTKGLQVGFGEALNEAKYQFGPPGLLRYLDYLGEQQKKDRVANTPFGWFAAQPHLDPPAPFNNAGEGEVVFANFAGLKP